MKYLGLIIAATTLTFLTGCQAYESSYRHRPQAAQPIRKYNPAVAPQNNQLQAAAMRSEFDGVYEKIEALTAKLNQMDGNQNVLSENINNLQQQLSNKAAENKQLRAELENIKQQIENQDQQVRGLIDNVVDQVAKDTASALDSMQKQQTGTTSSGASAGFYEYKVQPGATLGAISKAYKCTVKDIKVANNLNNDIIYVGQKLKIPK